MIHFHFGTDWYGAVKRVGESRVATAFLHVNSFPLYPRYSAVIGRNDDRTQEFYIPLTRKDWQSVTIAYVRGVAGCLVVVGSILLIFGFMFWLLNDGQTDIPPALIMAVGGVMIAVGAVLGGFSYLVWRKPPSREHTIRRLANAHLRAPVDPVLVDRALASQWAADIEGRLNEYSIADYRDATQRAYQFPQGARELMLLRLRCELAMEGFNVIREGQTELLLRDIAIQSHVDC